MKSTKCVSLREAARRTGLDRRTLAALVDSGKLPSIDVKGPKAKRPAPRIPEDALEKFMEGTRK